MCRAAWRSASRASNWPTAAAMPSIGWASGRHGPTPYTKAGRWEESAAAFRVAEAMQAEFQPGYPRLYSLQGFDYCDLLMGRAEPEDGSGQAGLGSRPEEAERFRQACREVLERARQTLEYEKQGWYGLLDIALDHLSLGRAHLGLALAAPGGARAGGRAQAAEPLHRAVSGLRRAGREDHLPRSLLACA